jgi:Transglycosylase SLT domain
MKKILGLMVAGLIFASIIPLTVAWATLPAMLSPDSVATGAAPAPPALNSGPDPARVPAFMLGLYRSAAATCPGLSWTVLAAIGTVESDNGQSTLPGVHSGANEAGAQGPMQFEPATFAMYDEPVPPGGVAPPSPYDPTDAVYAAARMLCADGASSPSSLGQAIFDYNHSAAYVAQVLSLARSYGYGGT